MQLLAIVLNVKALRWLILALCLATVATELALGRSHVQIGLDLGSRGDPLLNRDRDRAKTLAARLGLSGAAGLPSHA